MPDGRRVRRPWLRRGQDRGTRWESMAVPSAVPARLGRRAEPVTSAAASLTSGHRVCEHSKMSSPSEENDAY